MGMALRYSPMRRVRVHGKVSRARRGRDAEEDHSKRVAARAIGGGRGGDTEICSHSRSWSCETDGEMRLPRDGGRGAMVSRRAMAASVGFGAFIGNFAAEPARAEATSLDDDMITGEYLAIEARIMSLRQEVHSLEAKYDSYLQRQLIEVEAAISQAQRKSENEELLESLTKKKQTLLLKKRRLTSEKVRTFLLRIPCTQRAHHVDDDETPTSTTTPYDSATYSQIGNTMCCVTNRRKRCTPSIISKTPDAQSS